MQNREIIEQFCRKGYQSLKIKALMTMVLAAAWWGVLYPELCFTEETCQAVVVEDREADAQQEAVQPDEVQRIVSQQMTYKEVLEATGDDVVIKSRFLEWLEQHIEDQ